MIVYPLCAGVSCDTQPPSRSCQSQDAAAKNSSWFGASYHMHSTGSPACRVASASPWQYSTRSASSCGSGPEWVECRVGNQVQSPFSSVMRGVYKRNQESKIQPYYHSAPAAQFKIGRRAKNKSQCTLKRTPCDWSLTWPDDDDGRAESAPQK